MASHLPLNALHVFCVVVREGGFRHAAQALCITPGAVSRQIRLLEEHTKSVLFDRGTGAAAQLTLAGEQLYARVADALETVTGALTEQGAGLPQTTLLVDAGVTLAMHWLLPLLPSFQARHPDIRVQIQTNDGLINPIAPVDVFLRRDVGELRDLPARVFMKERSVLVASPGLLTADGAQGEAVGGLLPRLPRIATRSRPDLWPHWCDVHGVDWRSLKPALDFDNTVLSIQAAVQGLGALVVPDMFVATMLASGQLILLDEVRVDTGSYLLAIGRGQESRAVRLFVDWLMAKGGTL